MFLGCYLPIQLPFKSLVNTLDDRLFRSFSPCTATNYDILFLNKDVMRVNFGSLGLSLMGHQVIQVDKRHLASTIVEIYKYK